MSRRGLRQFGLSTLSAGWVQLAAGAAPGVGESETDQIRLLPPRGEIPPGFWELHLWHVVAASLLGLGLITLGIWWWLRPKPAATTPADVQAREALLRLAEEPETGQLLSRVSQVLRGYFSAVFGLPPGQLTTGEFARAIAESDKAEPGLGSAAVQLLRACDERKFAPAPPAAPLRAVPEALRLIELSERRRAEMAEAGGSPAQAAPGTRPGGSA